MPGERYIGEHQVRLEASDGRLSTTLSFVISVVPAPCLERAVFGDPAQTVGEEVAQVQVVAASGESGTPTGCPAFGPCGALHFGVYHRSWALDLPVNFRNAGGPLDARGGLVGGAVYLVLP